MQFQLCGDGDNVWFWFCDIVLNVPSSLTIISPRKRALATLFIFILLFVCLCFSVLEYLLLTVQLVSLNIFNFGKIIVQL